MIARRALFRLLSRLEGGRIEVLDADGRRFGFGPPAAALHATVTVRDPAVYRHAFRGSTGLADTYMAGEWEVDDLVALFRITARSMGPLDRLRQRWHPLLHGAQRLARTVPRNDRWGSRRNIAAHYDLGNGLFELFLDPAMVYSCAYFESPDASLADAQTAKLDRICRALDLRPGERLLEIGTGWGALAIHAAREYGARVTTTTISKDQHDLAVERVRAAGLTDSVTVLLEDYRDLGGSYDKLVSVEMIEAVGWQYFATFFRRCSELLEPHGAMLLQAITIDDSAYEVEKASRSFANTHVFPGGCLPSLPVIQHNVDEHTDLRPVWLDDITDHYVTTIARWREAFERNAGRAAELGYDEPFRRMWRLYLAYVEAGFAERRIGDVQLLLAKPGWTGDAVEGASYAASG
ncbi:MAG TPA: cyclopropane-fatty-acyl-phospholipid synthase family protein [Thermoleophilaceae bacterium]|nr:cyclopropane-fatty-acyl-phospholipid synthase family protein [Thermoleophilaceae bacterium]